MKRKALWAALAASLAFNIFFLIGLLAPSGESGRRSREGLLDSFTDQLGMDAEQRAAFEKWREAFSADTENRRDEWRARFDKMLDEIVKDEPDPAVIEEYVTAGSGPERRRERVAQFHAFMQILRPEQRRQAVQIIRDRMDSAAKSRPDK